MAFKTLINKCKRAYEVGFFYTINHLFWNLKFFFLRLFGVNKVRSKYDVKLYADYDDATFRFYYFAIYGFFYSDYLSSYDSKFTFIDIGANKGLYTVLAAKNANCEKILSFEPIPSTFEYLKKNSALNDIAHKCDLHNLAISDKSEDIEIPFNSNHSGTASLATQNQLNVSETVKIRTVNYETLEAMFSSKAQNYVLKVDVEGFELTVLAEIFKCDFSKSISSIFYEVDEKWENPNLLENLLRNMGFSHFKKIGDGTHYDVLATKNI